MHGDTCSVMYGFHISNILFESSQPRGGCARRFSGMVSRETQTPFLVQLALGNAHRHACAHRQTRLMGVLHWVLRCAPRIELEQCAVLVPTSESAQANRLKHVMRCPHSFALAFPRGTRRQTSPVQAITCILLSRSTSSISAFRSSLRFLPSSFFAPLSQLGELGMERQHM